MNGVIFNPGSCPPHIENTKHKLELCANRKKGYLAVGDQHTFTCVWEPACTEKHTAGVGQRAARIVGKNKKQKIENSSCGWEGMFKEARWESATATSEPPESGHQARSRGWGRGALLSPASFYLAIPRCNRCILGRQAPWLTNRHGHGPGVGVRDGLLLSAPQT